MSINSDHFIWSVLEQAFCITETDNSCLKRYFNHFSYSALTSSGLKSPSSKHNFSPKLLFNKNIVFSSRKS